MAPPWKKILIASCALTALNGCLSFGSKPPALLMTLAPPPSLAPDSMVSAANGSSITVIDPETPRKLDTVRIPVQLTDTSIAYIKGAQWVDRPRKLFRELLAKTLAADGTVLVLEPGQYPVDSGRRVMGELLDFGIDEQTKLAVVTYEATVTADRGRTIFRRRFTATQPVQKIDARSVATPLSLAARQVAADASAWIKTL